MRMCFLLGLQLHAQNLLALSCISNYVSLQLRMVLIKCCDISNEVRPTDVAEPWVDCLLEEYFIQVPQCKQFLFTSALKMNMIKSYYYASIVSQYAYITVQKFGVGMILCFSFNQHGYPKYLISFV